jgi:hypothetical protein
VESVTGDVGTNLTSATVPFSVVASVLKWLGPIVFIAIYADFPAYLFVAKSLPVYFRKFECLPVKTYPSDGPRPRGGGAGAMPCT